VVIKIFQYATKLLLLLLFVTVVADGVVVAFSLLPFAQLFVVLKSI